LGSTEHRFYAMFPNPGGLFMITARSFVRFALAGMFVNALAVACVVENNGSDDDDNTPCEEGDTRSCVCPDSGDTSVRECNASGTGFGSCQCEGSSNAGSGGNTNAGGEGNTTAAGNGSIDYGGETSSQGGASNPGAGGTPAETGGAGGSGEVDPGLCAEDPQDTCADCYQQGCCDQWTACANDDTCLTEFLNIMACSDLIKAERNVLPIDLQTCAEDEGAAAGPWSQGVSPLTVDVVNCVGGEDEGGWETMPWGRFSCKLGCFDN
jgi:hypothetical protein